MKKSLRSIGIALFVLGGAVLSLTTAYELSAFCQSGQGTCFAAGVIFGVPEYQLAYESDMTLSQSTSGAATAYPSVFSELILLLKTVGVYLVFLGVVTLVILELVKLHYIRMLLRKKQA
tara:strand:- start:1782 stop:2138 length:357 start_codon:yes stop_codon:yes gene_type:complete